MTRRVVSFESREHDLMSQDQSEVGSQFPARLSDQAREHSEGGEPRMLGEEAAAWMDLRVNATTRARMLLGRVRLSRAGPDARGISEALELAGGMGSWWFILEERASRSLCGVVASGAPLVSRCGDCPSCREPCAGHARLAEELEWFALSCGLCEDALDDSALR